MEIALVILRNAVCVVYLVMVVYILWTDNKLRKALECRDQQLVHAYDAVQFHFSRWGRNWEELKKLKKDFEAVCKENEKLAEECVRLRAKNDELLREKEELNKRHLALCDEHYHLSCAHQGFTKVVLAHKIDPKEVLAVIEECEKEAKEAKTVVGIPFPNPDEERDIHEETSNPDDDYYEDWEEKMVAAAEEE